MLHLRERLLPLLRATAANPHTSAATSSSSSSLYLSRLLLSTSANATAAIPFSVDDYLIATCGLTNAQALKSSAKLSRLKSASNPDAVLALLSGVGLSRADIAAVVAAEPQILCGNVDNIARRIASLRDRVGLTDPQIRSFLLAGGATGLRKCDIASRVEFWIPILGSFEMLLKLVRRNNVIVVSDVERVFKPNVALLQECGLPVCDIAKLAGTNPRLLTFNPERVKTFVRRADVLGVQRTSSRFKYLVAKVGSISEESATARMKLLSSILNCSMDSIRSIVCRLPSVISYSEENLRNKIEFLTITVGCSQDKIGDIVCKVPGILSCSGEHIRSKIDFLASILGCSKDNICAVVCKKPQILALSVENIRCKLNFMINEIGLESEYIEERPCMLTYSLEKRIVPRHSVIKILRTMGLIKEDVSFYNVLTYCEKDFIGIYIYPYQEAAPMLADFYAAACGRENRLLPLLRAGASHLRTSVSSTSSSLHLSRLLLSTAARSAAAAAPFSVEDYLVETCGLTGAQALKSSAQISHLRSASNPDAVLAHLSGVGLSRADLAAVVSAEPGLLCVRADNIARRVASLRGCAGLSDPQIHSLLLSGGAKGLRGCDIATRVEFWILFLGSFERLLKLVKSNYTVLTSDIQKVIKPNIALLQECGLTVCDIANKTTLRRMLTMNPKRVETSVQHADELGIARSSGVFKYMLAKSCSISGSEAMARMRFLSSTLGCPMDKIRDIVCKSPSILGYTQQNENLCRKINFMVTEVGLEPKYIIERTFMLTYSLEKRIVPRNSVIKILRTVGLMKEDAGFSKLLTLSEKNFIARYIDPYKQEVPMIEDAYAAACTGKMSDEVQL
uniref:Uncharacterized protein n=1 Tax=Leersia perrieri TaxID=77586 RepID=A0A0D9XQ91_9ORYZ